MKLPIALLTLLPLAAFAVPPLTVSYDMSGQPLTIVHDGAGVYSFDGLPYPGTVLYTPANGVVYYQHPEDPVWHTVTPAMLRGVVVPATISQGPVGAPWQQNATYRWNITTPATNPIASPQLQRETQYTAPGQGTACPAMFASQAPAAMSGLNVTDLTYVLATLQWLNGGGIPNPCEKLQFSADEATAIGLPTTFTGPNGSWHLQEIVQTSTTLLIPMPHATPMDDATRLRLLLIQFSPDDRASLMREYGHLPTQQQIEQISPLLTQETIAP